MSYNWVGWLLAIIFGGLNLYQYLIPRNKRKLLYSINPLRTRIVSSMKGSDLKILYKNKALENENVSAVQIAIWNAGNESVEKGDILIKSGGPKEIIVRTDPPVRILETLVNKPQRDVTGFEIINSAEGMANGEVHISWDILEKKDGASIQLLYAGEPETSILVKGTIKGQGNIKHIKRESNEASPKEQRKSQRQQNITFIMLFFISLISGVLKFIIGVDWDIMLIIFVFSGMMFLIMGLSVIQNMRKPFPPFDF